MTIRVDNRGDKLAALSPGQRQEPPCGPMVSGLAIVGKRPANKEGYRPNEKAVGGGSVSATHCFFITLFRFSRVAAAPESS
jgi:hypothetical protein